MRGDKTIALGTNEVTVLDQATGYAVFSAGGLESHRHAILQLTDTNGNVLWDADRDMAPRRRVLSEQAAKSMIEMMVRIPEVGTARKAQLSMTRAAGKTGTTQSYRDAWFVGYTGNFTAAVWYGNDSYRPTNKMTGGSLPAMTWQRVMEAAHQGIELRPLPYLEKPFPDAPKAKVAAAEGEAPRPVRPLALTLGAQKVLSDLADRLSEAPPLGPETLASNRDDKAPLAVQR